MRYEYDSAGRIVGSRSDAIYPHFVLVRAAEGCSWRLGGLLSDQLVIDVARLAGREPGLGEAAAGEAPAPERLVAIERLFERAGVGGVCRREIVEHGSRAVGELWVRA